MALINNFPITINNSGGSGSSVPSGGTIGQALVKRSATDGDVEWGNIIPASEKGTSSGVAELDSNGKVPSSQLPSYVDDVIEGYYNSTDDRFYEESTFTTLITPESSKSWVDISSNKSYRWSGSVYIRVDEGVQLGETSSSAYRGDRGKISYDFSQTPYTNTPSMDGTGSAGSSSAWARGDHVHPSDTTKTDKVSGAVDGHLAALNSSGNLTDSGMKPGLDTTDWSDIMTPLPGQPTEGIIISPEERQVGWYYNMDGSGTKKPLYQKTIASAISAAESLDTLGQINNVSTIVSLTGCLTSSIVSYSIPMAGANGAWYAYLYYVSGEIKCDSKGFANYTPIVTIQYTKTTDTYA